MAKRRILIFLIIFFGVFYFQNAFAKKSADELKQQCIDEANERDPTGSLVETCTPSNLKADSNLGTAYIVNDAKGIPESDGLNNDVANAYVSGAVLVKNTSTGNFWGTHAKILNKATTSGTSSTSPSSVKSEWIDNDFKIIGSSRSFYRGKGRGEAHTWSTENTDTSKMLPVRILKSFFAHASNEEKGIYKKKVYVYRCYGDKKDDSSTSSCFSKAPTYALVRKIARFTHSEDKNDLYINYGGSNYHNGDTITVPTGTTSASITVYHTIERADGWIQDDDATTYYSFNSTSRGTALTLNKSSSGSSKQSLSENKEITGISTTAQQKCYNLSYYTVTGLSGYDAKKGSGKSEICINIIQDTPPPPTPTDGKISIQGSSTVKDSNNNSNKGSSITISLAHDQDSVEVDFTHKVYRNDTADFSQDVTYSVVDDSDSSRGKSSTTVSLKKNGKETFSDKKVKIKVNKGESKTVCQTLSWNPQTVKFETLEGAIQTSSITPENGNLIRKACAKVTRENTDSIKVGEHSTVQIAGVSDNNNNNTKSGLASIKRDNNTTSYSATFTHTLKISETLEDSSVNYWIYLVKNGDTSNPNLRASGTVDFASKKEQPLLSDVQTVTATGADTGSICEYVVYSPSSLLKTSDGKSAGGDGTITTYSVCAEVLPPDPEPGKITAKTTTNSSYTLPYTVASGTFHFAHYFYNSNNLGVALSTNYTVYAKKTVTTDGTDGNIASTTPGEYIARSGKSGTYSDIPANTAYTTPVIDSFNYNIEPGQSVEYCEYIEFSPSNFQLTDGSVSGSGSDHSEERCMTISRPAPVWVEDDNFEITGSTSHLFPNTTELYGTGNNRLIGKKDGAEMKFTHILTFPNKAGTTRVRLDDGQLRYSYETSLIDGTSISFNNKPSAILDPGTSIELSDNHQANKNTIFTGTINPGEEKSECRNIYFKHSKFIVSHAYLYLHGVKLSDEIKGTIQSPVEGSIGNSDLVCASITRPYNFRINKDSLKTTLPKDTVYSGDSIPSTTYSFKVEKSSGTTNGIDRKNLSLTGIPNARIQLLAITIDDNSKIDNSFYQIGKSRTTSSEPCDFYSNNIRAYNPNIKATCGVIEEQTPSNKYIIGKGQGSASSTTPYYKDDNDFVHEYKSLSYSIGEYENGQVVNLLSPGQKFCIAFAVAPSDSNEGFSPNDFNTDWTLSSLSCANVAKKPTFQVHGSSIFSQNGIEASKSILDDIEREYKAIPDGINRNTYILIDNSGSMTGPISNFIARGLTIAENTLKSNGKVAIYAFADASGSSGYIRERCGFRGDNTCTLDNIEKNSAAAIEGGTGGPGSGSEDPLTAFLKAYEENPPDSGAKVNVVILTDAGADNDRVREVAELSKNNGYFGFYVVTDPRTIDMTETNAYTEMESNNVIKAKIYSIDDDEVYEKINIDIGYELSVTHNRSYFGSWGDFSLISSSKIIGMASGAALAGGIRNNGEGTKGANSCDHSPLTIANTKCADDAKAIPGGASITRTSSAETVFNALQARLVNTKDLSPDGFNEGGVKTTDKGKISTFNNNKIKVYYSEGNISIDSSLAVDRETSYSTLSEIPQIVILAGGNVEIDENVEKIDAWIVSKGTINTCAGYEPDGKGWKKGGEILGVENCNKQLTINGAVIARNIYLPRTYGADPSISLDKAGSLLDAAEIINYDPSTILWGYNRATNENIPKITILNELPPRY